MFFFCFLRPFFLGGIFVCVLFVAFLKIGVMCCCVLFFVLFEGL